MTSKTGTVYQLIDPVKRGNPADCDDSSNNNKYASSVAGRELPPPLLRNNGEVEAAAAEIVKAGSTVLFETKST